MDVRKLNCRCRGNVDANSEQNVSGTGGSDELGLVNVCREN